MSIAETEHVLVVPTDLLHRLGYFQGFSPEVDRYLDQLLSAEHTSYRPRDAMEEDPSFKQLIPYLIFRHTADDGSVSLFQYTRGKGQGEQRLHHKRSIGVGGHISSLDGQTAGSRHPYEEGMQRELAEEVVMRTTYRQKCVGLINDDETEVGKVHLGVVHVLDVEQPAVEPREADLADAGFQAVSRLLAEREAFESWSQICLDALFG